MSKETGVGRLGGVLLVLASVAAGADSINFDGVASGTNINNQYAGVTFSNPLGVSVDNPDSPNIFAVAYANAASPGNVVSVFDSGVPAFDSRYGAVQATFGLAQNSVSIDAAILRAPEGLGTPTNAPKLEIFGTSGFITAILWNFTTDPQPGAGGFAGWQTLSYTAAGNDITSVRFLSGNPGGAPSNFGLFDNFVFTRFTNGGGGTVPEPGTLALLGLGLAGLGLSQRRKAA